MRSAVISGISPNFLELSQSQGQVAHVLLTRSPLGHPPEGGASLDLHVLSTPPAFVLSQDQTLRECIWTPGHPEGRAGLSTQKVTVLETVSITGHTSWVFHLLDVPKESFTPGGPDADESYLWH